MDEKKLDQKLREITEREKFYIANPGVRSVTYDHLHKRTVRGQEAWCFEIPSLGEDEIHFRKDSRFTDVPRHVHNNVNINYIYSGKCDYVINGKNITLTKGDVIINDINVVKEKKILGEDDIVINLNMSHEFFRSSFFRKAGEKNLIADFMLYALSDEEASHDHYLLFRTSHEPQVGEMFCRLLEEYYDEEPYRKEMIRSYFQMIFILLLRFYQKTAEDPKANGNEMVQVVSASGGKVLDMLYYIEMEYRDGTLQELAERFGYHPKYVSQLLKKTTGSTFKQLQMRERMKNAARLLAETEEPVHRIAENTGIGNMSFFYRTFENTYGMLPNAYRNQSKLEKRTE